jgi:hypothetical protein
MIKAPSSLQDLRRRSYHKAKSDPPQRFWGIFGPSAKLDTRAEAYQQAKRNGGAPGLDGRTFADSEAAGLAHFRTALRDELRAGTSQPQPHRVVEIPKDKGKVRKLQIPMVPSYCTSIQAPWGSRPPFSGPGYEVAFFTLAFERDPHKAIFLAGSSSYI